MARRSALVLTGFALMAGLLAQSGAQESDFCRKDAFGGPNAKAEVYARRSGGYCDGAVFQPHSGSGELPVIGVNAAPIVGDPKSQSVSITAIALPKSLSGIVWPLHLQGVARSPKVNYRLDAALSSGRPLVVGPESAMSRVELNLRAEDVAWSAWSDSSQDGRTYVPVVMPEASGGDVELTVRPTIPVAYVVYSVKDASGGLVKGEATIRAESTPDRRSAPMTLVIPAGKPELVVVKVIAVGNNGRTQAASVRLIRPGGAGH